MIKRIPINSGIRSKLIPELRNYFQRRTDVLFAYLFGSSAKGRTTPLSDIDIAVYLSDRDLPETRLDIIGDLMNILGTDEIDLVILNSAPISLQMRIIQNRQILADTSPFVRHAFESATMRTYFDFSKIESTILERRYFGG